MENLSTKRDKIIKSLFQNELSNIQEELDAIKEAGTNPENVCSQINWDAKDLEGKTNQKKQIKSKNKKKKRKNFQKPMKKQSSTF